MQQWYLVHERQLLYWVNEPRKPGLKFHCHLKPGSLGFLEVNISQLPTQLSRSDGDQHGACVWLHPGLSIPHLELGTHIAQPQVSLVD